MSIQTVVDLIEAKLLEDPTEWGKALFWNNLDSFQNDYQSADLPVTAISADNTGMAESSTQSDHATWEFTIKGVFWVDEKVTTKAHFLERLRLETSLGVIYNNIVNNLDCEWVEESISTNFESIDERMTITGRFSITIQTIR